LQKRITPRTAVLCLLLTMKDQGGLSLLEEMDPTLHGLGPSPGGGWMIPVKIT